MGLPGLTRGAADKRYAASGAPSYAGTRTNRFDTRTGWYNAKGSNTRKARAGLAKSGVSTAVSDWVVASDSTASNYLGTIDGNDNLAMWPRVMRNLLVAAGHATVGGTGQVPAAATGTIDPRWTSLPGFTNNNTYLTGGTGAVATFSTVTYGNETGTAFDIYFRGDSGTFTVTIDGATPANGVVTLSAGTYSAGTVTPDGSAVYRKLTITGLADTTHTLVLTRTAGTLYLVSAGLRRASGLVVHNLAQSGSSASGAAGWGDTTGDLAISRRAMAPTAPDVLLLSLGVNDLTGGTAPATVVAALTTVRGYWPNAEVYLVGQYQRQSVTAADWEAYLAALYTLADTLDCPLLDMYYRSGGYAVANANGLMGDTVHPNKAAQRGWASAFSGMLTDSGTRSVGTTAGTVTAGDDTRLDLPYLAVVPGTVPPNVASSATTQQYFAASFNNVITYGDGALNNYYEWEVFVAAGTYTLRTNWNRTTNAGICTISVDGVDQGATIDMYGTAAPNQATDRTGIVLTAGRHKVRYRAAAKNASSTAYYIQLHGFSLTRTGA